MRVNLSEYPKLANELAPLLFRKEFNVSSADAMWILKTQFDIDAKINYGERLMWVEIDEKTFTWLNIKWR